jgi:hypothetical protein
MSLRWGEVGQQDKEFLEKTLKEQATKAKIDKQD